MRSLLLPRSKGSSRRATRLASRVIAAVFATSLLAFAAKANDGAKIRAPLIAGRPVPELVLTVPIHLGRQHPGMLIMPEITVLPNRFTPVREDADGIYYQAVSQFMPGPADNTGGLYLDKKNPERVWAYVGDGRGADFRVGSSADLGRTHSVIPHDFSIRLPPEYVRKLKIAQPLRK